jgi:hypothetical protein
MMTRTWIVHRYKGVKFTLFRCTSADFSSPAAKASRCRGNDLGATIMYLRKTQSGAAGSGLGTTPNYLRGVAGNGRAQR